jgi:hypothetical protein
MAQKQVRQPGKVVKTGKKFELIPDAAKTVETAALTKIKDADTAAALSELFKRVAALEER